MSVNDIITNYFSELPPVKPPMILDLSDSYKENHCTPCDLQAVKEVQYPTGMTIPPHIAKEALKLYSDNRPMLPKGPKERAVGFEEHGQITKIHRMYLNKFNRELKNSPAAAKQLYQELKRNQAQKDHKFGNRVVETMNKINRVHPFNAKAKWNKIDPDIGEPILRQMEGLIEQGKVGAAYQKLQQLYDIQPANRVQEIDRRGFRMQTIVQ